MTEKPHSPEPAKHERPEVTEPPSARPLRNEAFQARAAFDDALQRLVALTKDEVVAILRDGPLDVLLRTIAPVYQNDRREGELLYDYLLRNKAGLTLLAQLRRAITDAYSLEGQLTGKRVYVAPNQVQWFQDGVMFTQGEERFSGLIGLYRGGKVSFAISARDVREGESLGPDDFLFIDVDEYRRLAAEQFRQTPTEVEDAPRELARLLDEGVCDEAAYQQYLGQHPWVFGAQYRAIQSHERLDDRNIPDFSGARLRDGSRDILEIKSPCLNLFTASGEFSAEFNRAWHQVERYLDFARRDPDYLWRQRGLRFDNPHCYLVAGRRLAEAQISQIRAKERMNPAITFFTYDDLRILVDGTVGMIKKLQSATSAPSLHNE